MLINKIYNQNIPQKPTLTFGSGQVTLFSDFDDTLMPKEFNHSVLGKAENRAPFNKDLFKQIFDPFNNFIDQMKQKFDFIITSGRNLYEIKFNVDNIPKDVNFPTPKAFISSNGADILEHTGNGFNYAASQVTRNKEAEIKTLTGWDAEIVKKEVKKILENNGFEVIESKVNSSYEEYGNFSIDERLKELGKSSSNRFASIRQDENLHINISFARQTNIEEMEKVYQELEKSEVLSKITCFIDNDKNKNGIAKYFGKYSGGYKQIKILPKIGDSALSKLYDPFKLLQKAVKDNDFIIVAGDSSNDREMLNLFRYVDTSKYADFPVKTWREDKGDYVEDLKKAYEYLKKSPDLQKEISNLPIISIIVENDKNSIDMVQLKEYLASLNKNGITKFLYVNPNNGGDARRLSEAVKLAVNKYSQQNNEFAKNLSIGICPELRKELNLPELIEKTTDEVINSEAVKKSKKIIDYIFPMSLKTKWALGSTATLATVATIIAALFKPRVLAAQNLQQNAQPVKAPALSPVISPIFKDFIKGAQG